MPNGSGVANGSSAFCMLVPAVLLTWMNAKRRSSEINMYERFGESCEEHVKPPLRHHADDVGVKLKRRLAISRQTCVRYDPAMNPTPRLLTPDDAATYLEFRREMLDDSPWSFLATPDDDVAAGVERIAANLRNPENVIVGVFEKGAREPGSGRLLSTAGVVRKTRAKVRHRAIIWGVYTTPGARRRGLSRLVMTLAIEVARSWPGVDIIGLSVSARAAEAAKLYESLGFVRWGSEPDAIRIGDESFTEIHMQLRL